MSTQFVKYLLLFDIRHGNNERVFRLEFVSNQEFTDSEFLKYVESSAAQNVPLPTVEKIAQKVKDIKEALLYEFKDEDINQVNFYITTLPCLFKF